LFLCDVQELLGLVSSLLGFEITPDEPLMEAGLDSIGAVELRNSVGARFGIELPATVTFDHPSPAALARYLASRLAPKQAVTALHPQAMAAALPRQPAQQARPHSSSCFCCCHLWTCISGHPQQC
jgi:acyl carrier protein